MQESDEEGGDHHHAGDEDKLTQAAVRKLATHIVLIADKGGGDIALAEQIAETQAVKFQARQQGVSGKGSVVFLLDPANMTESSSHPHLRKAQVPPNTRGSRSERGDDCPQPRADRQE